MGRLDGTHAIITGATQGIGLGCVRVFAAEGAKVSALDLMPMPDFGPTVNYLHCDVRDRTSVNVALSEARVQFGPIDAVLHIAGTAWHADLSTMTDHDYDSMMDVHVRGAFHLLRGVVAEWQQRRRGKFIGVTSPAAVRGQAHGTAYSAAKSAIIGLIKSAALELAPYNVQVNGVLPMAATPMTAETRADPEVNAEYLRRVPLGRWGEPDEIARAFAFLASGEADYITGTILTIDGGRTI